VIAAYTCLSALALVALVMMGWNQWSTTEMVKTQTKANESMAKEWREATLTLILGYRDSLASSEPLSTEPNESETLPRDENSLDDMPEHIREHYLREATEDDEREMISSIRSYPLPESSS
jgi:hypothetical protein